MFKTAFPIIPVGALVCLLSGSVIGANSPVMITEFMAGNSRTLANEDRSYEDWIEIYNTTTNGVDLSNWSLTDSAGNLGKWRFPATNIGPSRFMVVFASGKNRRIPGAPLHTNFRLDQGGEKLALVQADGTIASEFAPSFPGQYQDVTYGFPMESLFAPVLTSNALVRVFVPRDDHLGSNWTQLAFDDSAWLPGTNGVGFDTGQIDRGRDTYNATVLDGSPLAYWRLNESGGTTAVNSGRLGAAGNAAFEGSPALGQAGPRPAAYNGFETTNNAPRFNGTNQLLNAGQSLLNNRGAFALAGLGQRRVAGGNQPRPVGTTGRGGGGFSQRLSARVLDGKRRFVGGEQPDGAEHLVSPGGRGRWAALEPLSERHHDRPRWRKHEQLRQFRGPFEGGWRRHLRSERRFLQRAD